MLEQADVGDKQWRIVNVQMEMTLRILFKTRVINTSEQMTRYTPVPAGMDYRQAIQMLRGGVADVHPGRPLELASITKNGPSPQWMGPFYLHSFETAT